MALCAVYTVEEFSLNNTISDSTWRQAYCQKIIFRMGIKKRLFKNPEFAVGVQSYNVDFTAAIRQFDWLEISLVYNKNDKDESTYSN